MQAFQKISLLAFWLGLSAETSAKISNSCHLDIDWSTISRQWHESADVNSLTIQFGGFDQARNQCEDGTTWYTKDTGNHDGSLWCILGLTKACDGTLAKCTVSDHADNGQPLYTWNDCHGVGQ